MFWETHPLMARVLTLQQPRLLSGRWRGLRCAQRVKVLDCTDCWRWDSIGRHDNVETVSRVQALYSAAIFRSLTGGGDG